MMAIKPPGPNPDDGDTCNKIIGWQRRKDGTQTLAGTAHEEQVQETETGAYNEESKKSGPRDVRDVSWAE
jgi:hypothetical protein